MTKLKKQRKKKVYNYERKRSRVRKQQERTTKFNVKVDCKAIKDNWDNRVTMKENMAALGVALNANSVLPFAGTKKSLINKLKKQKKVPVAVVEKPEVNKPEVVSKLEAEANVEAKQNFRFTTTQVQLITCMMEKQEPLPRDHSQVEGDGDQVHQHSRTLCSLLQGKGTYYTFKEGR